MKSTLLTAAFLALALPAYAATTHKFTPPTVSKHKSRPTTRLTRRTWRRSSS